MIPPRRTVTVCLLISNTRGRKKFRWPILTLLPVGKKRAGAYNKRAMPKDPQPREPGHPHTEEQIRAATVGELKPLAGPILVIDYDPRWPELFEREAGRIRAALGVRVLSLEHVGSTSVPELAAKPVIDIVLAVADSRDEAAYVPALEAAGYRLRIRESDWHEHRMFKGPDTEMHLHVFSSGCPEIERMLVFRDWLRNHPADRDLYASSKQALAQKDWKYMQNYADAKTNVVEEIMARAARAKAR